MFSIFSNFAAKLLDKMGGYREKVDPTREGLEELDESTRNATIERLLAGIQYRHTKPEKLLELTQHFRNRQSIEEKELYRLGYMSVGYNRKWATKYNRAFGTERILLNKRQSQYKSWREILKYTSPRFKQTPRDTEEQQSIYKASFLTHRPYELDIWGPASYGRLVTDLWDVLNTIINHMDEGNELCNDIIAEENEIDNNPERKEELFWEQYDEEVERNRNTIALHVEKGIVDTDHPEYKKMLSYPDAIKGYARNDFHNPSDTQFSGFVITNETLHQQNNNITHVEAKLFGRDIKKIILVRFLIDHLEELITVNGQRFDKFETMYFIKWCNVKKSKKRNDTEHELFDYIRGRKKNSFKFYGWSSLFEFRKLMEDSEEVWEKPVAGLNKKINDLLKTYINDSSEPEK